MSFSLLTWMSDNSKPGSLAQRFRRRRFQLFESLLSRLPSHRLRIIDVGGTEAFWTHMGYADHPRVELELVNLGEVRVAACNMKSVAGDATSLSSYSDNQFDIAFSNSVIEHVGSRAQQAKMASEIRRVAPRYFVQTPSYYFPIEPHFLVPGFQWLPVHLRARMLQGRKLGWVEHEPQYENARQVVESIQLLRERDMRQLFPGAEIYCETVLGLTKSYIAYSGW